MISTMEVALLKAQALKELEESTATKPNANKNGWLGGKMNGTGQFADSWTYGEWKDDGKFYKTTKPRYI